MNQQIYKCSQTKFFLSATTSLGLKNYLAELQKEIAANVVLLKGAPASGKSALLARIAANASGGVERIYSAQEPGRLVGVVLYKTNSLEKQTRFMVLLDATAPHCLEPIAPGLREQVINLDCAMNISALKATVKVEQVDTLLTQIDCLQTRAARYVASAGGLLYDSCRAANCITDIKKVRKYTENLCARLLPDRNQKGVETKRFLSAITSSGVHCFTGNVTALANRIFVLHDEYGAVSKAFFAMVRKEATARGYDIIICPCALFGDEKIEHIFIPSLGIAFLTSNSWHSMQFTQAQNIHYTRFTDMLAFQKCRARMRFNTKAAKELVAQCSDLLLQIQSKREEMRDLYRPAMDITKLEITIKELKQAYKLDADY